MPNPSGDPGERDRRVASIGIATGVVTALVASAFGIVGTIVGVNLQAGASQREAFDEFQRAQRLDTYTAFILALDAADAAEHDVLAALETMLLADRDSASQRAYSKALDELLPKRNELSHVITKIRLVGTSDALEAALVLWDIQSEMEDKKGVAQTFDEVEAISRRYRDAFEEARSDFIETAADDVQEP